jgi:hypothetical protein
MGGGERDSPGRQQCAEQLCPGGGGAATGAVGDRFLGSPPGTPLHDVFLGSVGGMYRVLDALNAGALLDYRQAPSSSLGERLEVVPFASWKVDRHWSVDVYTSAGLAAGSPDVGVGLQIGYTLPSISSVTNRQ